MTDTATPPLDTAPPRNASLWLPGAVIASAFAALAWTVDGDLVTKNARSNWITTQTGPAFCTTWKNGVCAVSILKADLY